MSDIKLYDAREPVLVFSGRADEQMPILIADGRLPLSVAGIMKQRLSSLDASEAVQSFWWNNYWHTGDGIFYHPDGDVKIVRGAQQIRELKRVNGDTHLMNGALKLADDRDESVAIYESLNVESFCRKDLEPHTGRLFTRDEVKFNPLWNALVGDKELLDNYADATFDRAGRNNMMQTYFLPPQDVATCRLWFLSNLFYDSYTGGDDDIDDDCVRFAGVVLEAQDVKIKVPPTSDIAASVNAYLAKSPVLELSEAGVQQAVLAKYQA